MSPPVIVAGLILLMLPVFFAARNIKNKTNRRTGTEAFAGNVPTHSYTYSASDMAMTMREVMMADSVQKEATHRPALTTQSGALLKGSGLIEPLISLGYKRISFTDIMKYDYQYSANPSYARTETNQWGAFSRDLREMSLEEFAQSGFSYSVKRNDWQYAYPHAQNQLVQKFRDGASLTPRITNTTSGLFAYVIREDGQKLSLVIPSKNQSSYNWPSVGPNHSGKFEEEL